MKNIKEILKDGKILIAICLIVALLFVSVKQIKYFDSQGLNNIQTDENKENTKNNSQENIINEDSNEDETVDDKVEDFESEESSDEKEQEYIPYSEELPKFKNDFEKAFFLYGMFYDVGNLLPYTDQNSLVDDEWALIKLKGIKTLANLKELAYEVIDKKIIDETVAENQSEETPLFKETDKGLYINIGWASQYGPDLGYDGTYKKIVNNDGTIVYKIIIKDSIYDDSISCNVTYEYKMSKNIEGKLVFTNFEYPTNICLENIKRKENKTN